MGNNIFNIRIKQLRMNKNLSLDQFAKQLGLNKSRVGMWESNGTVPRDDILLKLSDFFEVSIDYLLGNEKKEGRLPDKEQLQYLQRNLAKLDDAKLDKAKAILSTVFDDIFNDDEDEDDDI